MFQEKTNKETNLVYFHRLRFVGVVNEIHLSYKYLIASLTVLLFNGQ